MTTDERTLPPEQQQQQEREVTIEQELAYVNKHWPGFLQFFYAKIVEGKICGEHYFDWEEETGDLYGWLYRYDNDYLHPEFYAIETRRHFSLSVYCWLPSEGLLHLVEPGDTPFTSDHLSEFERYMLPYLFSREG